MKNFVKVSMMLLVSQIAMACNGDSCLTTYTKQVDNLQITTTFLSEKHTEKHDAIREFALNLLISKKMLYTNSRGALQIIERQNINSNMNAQTPANHGSGITKIYTQENENEDSAKSYYDCVYTFPLFNEQN